MSNKESDEMFPIGMEMDVSDKYFLFYKFKDRDNIKIMFPKTLTIKSDGHHVTDIYGNENFVPYGFIHWKAKLDDKRDKRPDVLVEDSESEQS